MNDLNQIHIDDDDASSEGEDILGDIIPTPSESLESRSTDLHDDGHDEPDEEEPYLPDVSSSPARAPSSPEQATPQPTNDYQEPLPSPPATTTSQTLRPRTTAHPLQPDSAHTSARSALFGNRRKAGPLSPQSSTATAEALLDAQRRTQEALFEGILKITKDLKASSRAFGENLKEDTRVVEKVRGGMEKTEDGMDAATRGMGALRRMTEGKGWWGRMILYAWVYGLMVGLVLLVFVLPKLRF
jgi:hypothetical protein